METIDKAPEWKTAYADADAKAIIAHAMSGKLLDPAIAKRAREEGAALRREIFQKHGLVDIAVPAIREFRGELP